MRQSQIGNLVIVGVAVLNVALWLIFPPDDPARQNYVLQMTSEILFYGE